MKAMKKFLFFEITHNLIFISILYIQYIYRFGMQDDFIYSLMFAAYFSIFCSIAPFISFGLCWLITIKFLIPKLKLNYFFNAALMFLVTVTLPSVLMLLMKQDFILILITLTSTVLTLFLFFFMDRKNSIFKNTLEN